MHRHGQQRGFDSNRIASYLFFEDRVINRPNKWVLLTDNTEGLPPRFVGEKNEGDDPHEVGKEELEVLLEMLKTAQEVSRDQLVVSSST